MNLSFLEEAEAERLAGILGAKVEDLSDAMTAHTAAATEEYVRMFLGQRVYTRGSDIREYRLFLLIKHAFGGRIPSDSEVSRLFQTTDAQSRSLIRSVMSKFQYELQGEVDDTLRDLLASAKKQTGADDHDMVVHSENIVDELNRRIQTIDGTLPSIHKKRGTASTYVVKPSALKRLRDSLSQGGGSADAEVD
jgi:hypothetical protein